MASELVVHTTLSARAVAEFSATVYALPTPACVRLVRRGFNDVYELTAPEPLYLRIGRQGRRTLVDAELEAQVLAQAQAAGAPVALAIRGRDGRFAQRLEAPEGERAVLLFAAAPGSIAEDTPEHAAAQGRTLARLHQAALEVGTVARLRRLDAELLVSQPAEWTSEQLRDRPALAARFHEVAAGMRTHLDMLQANLSVGLCHGDCHGYNATVDRGTATFFDFDESGIGWIAYDLATFLWSCQKFSSSLRRPLWAHFLAGYRSVRTPAAADMDALEALVIVRELWAFGASAEGAPHWGGQWFRSDDARRRIEELAECFERLAAPRLA
jgi:Ser/Thr protein kinase RdoA (MazF antagonist)